MSNVTPLPLAVRLRLSMLRSFDVRTGSGRMVAVMFEPVHFRGDHQRHAADDHHQADEKCLQPGDPDE